MAIDLFEGKIINNALAYDEYQNEFAKTVEINDTTSFTEEEKHRFENSKMNLQRSKRIHKTFKPGDAITDLLANIENKQHWFVLTETWCGDSAQNIPCIAEFAKMNENIDLKLLFRDRNLDIIDQYLSNGTRSIPKLIAFDESGKELFQWGARPKEAQDLINQLKEEGKTKEEFLEKLHLWYGRNKGKAIEEEFIEILSKL